MDHWKEGYIAEDGLAYKLHSEKGDRDGSEATCRAEGARLPKLLTRNEMERVTEYCNGLHCWTGEVMDLYVDYSGWHMKMWSHSSRCQALSKFFLNFRTVEPLRD